MTQYIQLDTVRNIVNRTGCSTEVAQQICGLVDGTISPENYKAVKNLGEDISTEEKLLLAINELFDGHGVAGLQQKSELLAMFVDRGCDSRWTILFDCKRKEWLNTTVSAFAKHGGWDAVQLRRIPPDAMIRIGREEGDE